METKPAVFLVDDEPTTGMIVAALLGAAYEVTTFDCAEACLEHISAAHGAAMPDVFLLDVVMPGMDGYTLCRLIKQSQAGRHVPVIFLSGLDSLQDALAGYDAGAQDFVTKPFEHVALQRKIDNLLRMEREHRALRDQSSNADELSSVLMANLDEYAILIKYLRSLNQCTEVAELVQATLEVMRAYRVTGPIQVRLRDFERTYSAAGENWPMEIAVIGHVRTLGSLFEFKTRSVYNFPHMTILVTNMPTADLELCGRIRDNLCIVAESASEKLAALQADRDKATIRGEVTLLIEELDSSVRRYGARYNAARDRSGLHTTKLLDDLLRFIAPLGMTAEQEESLLQLVRERSDELIDLYDFADETRADSARQQALLERILTASESARTRTAQ